MTSPKHPPSAIAARTFEALKRFYGAFLRGELPALLIIGRPTVGKTEYFCLDSDPETPIVCPVHGTPMMFYVQAFKHLNLMLTLDDTECLWSDEIAVEKIAYCSLLSKPAASGQVTTASGVN